MTRLEVSPIAFGCWQLGGEWGEFDEGEAIAAIRRARSLGIDLFDTAQGYGFGASERLLGRALRDELGGNREEIVIATKGGLRLREDGSLTRDSSPDWLRRGVEQSLQALGLDFVDLYQVHWPDPDTPFAETAGALQGLVEEGKIRHVGVSNFDVAQMAEFAQNRPVETLQPAYHLFRREIEETVLPYTSEHDIGVLVYGPLAHGMLTGTLDAQVSFPADDWRSGAPFFRGEGFRRNLAVVGELEALAAELGCSISQLAIAWTLANPAVDVAIVGSRNPRHIEQAAGAAAIELSEDELGRIERTMAGAVPIAGPSPEMGAD
jgi:aryl-alcohol dehydrogenase-like predicted oxidoreductase